MLAKNTNDNAGFQHEKWRTQVFREQARSYSGLFHLNLTAQASFLQVDRSEKMQKCRLTKFAISCIQSLIAVTPLSHSTARSPHICYHEQEGRLQ